MPQITVRDSVQLAVDTLGSTRDALVLLIPGADFDRPYPIDEVLQDMDVLAELAHPDVRPRAEP